MIHELPGLNDSDCLRSFDFCDAIRSQTQTKLLFRKNPPRNFAKCRLIGREMAAASRGLPGFLRRSVRDYSEDDDDEPQEDGSLSSNDSGSSLPDTLRKDIQVVDMAQDKSSPAVLDNNQDPGRNLTGESTASSRASMPPINLSSQAAILSRQASEPRLAQTPMLSEPGAGSSMSAKTSDHDEQHDDDQLEKQPVGSRPKTYKETQFEKIFVANVVSMNDLKTLAWNGIPVRGLTAVCYFVMVHGSFRLRGLPLTGTATTTTKGVENFAWISTLKRFSPSTHTAKETGGVQRCHCTTL